MVGDEKRQAISVSVNYKFKQLLSNFEAQTQEILRNLRLAEKTVAYRKNFSVLLQGHTYYVYYFT